MMYSQLGQDLWVIESTNFKFGGTFIDIGAYDGIFHSNTFLLEKEYNWNGICVEPSSKFLDLQNNRICKTCNLLLYDTSNIEADFYETTDNLELSGIPDHFKNDGHNRNAYNKYKKLTISLIDLCKKYNLPSHIDYLSIDTEGSELFILEKHDFELYRFDYISIEHNRSQDYREKIKLFLESKNYKIDNSNRFLKINQDITTNFDDWYSYKG